MDDHKLSFFLTWFGFWAKFVLYNSFKPSPVILFVPYCLLRLILGIILQSVPLSLLLPLLSYPYQDFIIKRPSTDILTDGVLTGYLLDNHLMNKRKKYINKFAQDGISVLNQYLQPFFYRCSHSLNRKDLTQRKVLNIGPCFT